MTDKSIYNAVVQHYFSLNAEKRKLVNRRNEISAQIELIEGMLIDLNDILCKHGEHIYEHFEEKDGEQT